MRNATIVTAVLGLLIGSDAALAWTPVPAGRLNEVLIEDFESGVINDATANPKPDGYGWQITSNAGQFTWAIDATQGANGSAKSMALTSTSTVPYWYYINGNSKDTYILQGYDKPLNRMEYYIKLPQNWMRDTYLLTDRDYATANWNIGTYQRDPNQTLSAGTSTETYGWHFYYSIIYNMYDTSWVRVQLNQWPQHMRNLHGSPSAYPCKPQGDMFSNWTRGYFCGVPYTTDPGVGYPYSMWFDQWSFYYENEYVTISPESGDSEGTAGSALGYPIVVANTHPTETREFGLFMSNELFRAANYWTYNVRLYADTNGDGIHQSNETSQPTTTGTLQPGGKWRGVLVVTIPTSGTGAEIGALVQTNLTAWQKTPAYQGLDPHISKSRIKVGGVAQDDPAAVLHGTPCAGTTIFTRTVAAPAPADATPPAAIDDLCLVANGSHDAKFRWTAVGDNDRQGVAFAYEARYSTSPITAATWNSCTELTGEPDVYPSGTVQTWWMPPVLQPGTTYYLAIKVFDRKRNVSGLSNVVQFTTAIDQPDNVTPVAVAGADVTAGATPLTVHFSSAGSADVDGQVALYVWHFGDGTVSNDPNPTHTFNLVGTNTVTLTVFDNAGASRQATLTITTARGQKGTILLRNGRNGYASGWTNRIRSGGPTGVVCGASYGIPTSLVGMYGGANRMLVQFTNIPASIALPAGCRIRQAQVSLYHATNSNQIDAEVYSLQQAYIPTQASWNNASSGTPWTTSGAIPAGATPCTTLGLDGHSLMWPTFDATAWTRLGADIGVCIKLVQEPTATQPLAWFGTHDDTVSEHRPTLVVDYTLNGDVDYDGHVDVIDLLYLAGAFGSVPGAGNFDSRCDFDTDDGVDVVDLLMLAENFGR